MPFNDTPLRDETKSISSARMRENFERLRNYLEHDHNGINGAGVHDKATMLNQEEDPETLATDIAIYSKESAITEIPELYIKRALEDPYCATESWADDEYYGWTRESSGLLIKWGFAAVAGHQTFQYAKRLANAPRFDEVYNFQASVFYNIGPEDVDFNDAIRVVDFSDRDQFILYGSPRTTMWAAGHGHNTRCSWIAIGK